MRSSMYSIPCSSDLIKQSHLPFAVTISPFSKLHPQEVSCAFFSQAKSFVVLNSKLSFRVFSSVVSCLYCSWSVGFSSNSTKLNLVTQMSNFISITNLGASIDF